MKFTNAIVCEDVRVEASGKHILIGVFTTDIRIDIPDKVENPSVLLAFWFQVEDIPIGDSRMQLRVSLDQSEIMTGELNIAAPEAAKRFAVPMSPTPIPLPKSGTLKLEGREVGTKQWKRLTSIPVVVNVVPPSA